jgi:diguanylate cyclase (GGDEF)-like protein
MDEGDGNRSSRRAGRPGILYAVEEAAAAAHVADVDASAADVMDQRADQRDAIAAAGDLAAGVRATRIIDLTDLEQVQLDRLHAARDRAAAALDRREAALDRHRAAEYLRRTYVDLLTGALQRDAGRDQLDREVERAARSGAKLVIAFLDVVGLKRTNDEQGHDAGDRVLHDVGAALLGGLRRYDVVVRWGGDEFVCALPNSSMRDAERRFAQVQMGLNEGTPSIGLSVGLTKLTPGEQLREAINRADRNLYARRARA